MRLKLKSLPRPMRPKIRFRRGGFITGGAAEVTSDPETPAGEVGAARERGGAMPWRPGL